MPVEEKRAGSRWYEEARDYTLRLVKISSVSPGEGERLVAQEVVNMLKEGGLEAAYTAIGLDAIEHDAYKRENAYAFLRGQSAQTVVLLGHIDTVETGDYRQLEPWAIDPESLAVRLPELCALAPDLEADLARYPDDWMFGRGTIDMKCGVAAMIAVTRYLAASWHTSPLPLSIVLLATADEENESAGVLQAVRFLRRLQREYGLTYPGLINTDYTNERYAGDPQRYVYAGTVGKLLPSFLVVGREAHVGEPFAGADANLLAAELIRHLSMCDELCDVAQGQATPPPVTLRAADLKAHYDVQLPFMAYFYLNVLTLTTGPGELLQRLLARAEEVMSALMARIDEVEQRWARASGRCERAGANRPRSCAVLTYAELYQDTSERLGATSVQAALAAEGERLPADLDKRERSWQLVQRLWALSGRSGPAVVIYYSPPYYPHVRPSRGALDDAIAGVARAHPALRLAQHDYYPYISDMSYLRLDEGLDVTPLKLNMPVWQEREPGAAPTPGAYSLPLEDMRALNLPVVNFGPYGRGAHQSGERVLMSYSFGIFPQLLYETIERLGQMDLTASAAPEER